MEKYTTVLKPFFPDFSRKLLTVISIIIILRLHTVDVLPFKNQRTLFIILSNLDPSMPIKNLKTIRYTDENQSTTLQN